ncbi:MAG: DUF6695 family protein [Marinilabiliaceae bacterium]
MNKHNTGFAIALAWPATYCKQPGSWYDPITHHLKISTNRFYQVGHAALVLIHSETGKCHYFDFGRYHAPFQYGRVRSETTDPGLKIGTPAKISEDGRYIENFRDILNELQANHECHGDGDLHAAYSPVNFEKSFCKASQMQANSPLPYGPFAPNGSNCSRFVCTSILAGEPASKFAFRLKYLVFLTPTPLNNVNVLQHKEVVPKPTHQPVLRPAPFKNKNHVKTTLPQPERHKNIPRHAQWLSGEGAGSWFSLKKHHDNFHITRFNEWGETECKGFFKKSGNKSFDENAPYQVVHLSHCNKVAIRQNGSKIEFHRIEQEQFSGSKSSIAQEFAEEIRG